VCTLQKPLCAKSTLQKDRRGSDGWGGGGV
jgi:hypothetical protein